MTLSVTADNFLETRSRLILNGEFLHTEAYNAAQCRFEEELHGHRTLRTEGCYHERCGRLNICNNPQLHDIPDHLPPFFACNKRSFISKNQKSRWTDAFSDQCMSSSRSLKAYSLNRSSRIRRTKKPTPEKPVHVNWATATTRRPRHVGHYDRWATATTRPLRHVDHCDI